MARGRKPDTAEMQEAKGNPGKRRIAPGRLSPLHIGQVRPPKWLKRSRKATEFWNDLAPLLVKINLLTDLDAHPFGRYCRYLAEWIVADQVVQKEGTWFNATGTNGEATKKRHPAWQACQDIERILAEMESSFAMRPDARYKVMRDQALANGVLPLFDRDKGSDSEQPAAPAEVSEDDATGMLASFDSSPPGTRPN